MKKIILFLLIILSLSIKAQNPLFFGADPSARVFPDGKVWIYPTTDKANWDEQFDWHAWSSTDLKTWTDHGVIFDLRESGWATGHAWAPDILYKNGKYYFYYYAQQGKPGGGVGVAVSDKPEGPFKEALGRQLVPGHDPALFMDDDGKAFIYVQDKVYELNDDMISVKGEPKVLDLDYRSQKYEADYVFKRNGIYYYSFADGFNHLIYYMGNSPLGPFTKKGDIMETYGGNNHHSVVLYQGKWILFYHGWVPGKHRMVRAEYLTFNEDGTIQKTPITDKGVGTVLNSKYGGYLFAHMTKQDYGHLYYSVSKDGLHWTNLNNGKRVNEEYEGHPDITKGHDGKFYMTGGSKVITIWESDNLLTWKKKMDLDPKVINTSDFTPKDDAHGAAKIYFDEATKQYIITWHISQNEKDKDNFEYYWSGQRTLYVTTRDFNSFTDPHRLFQYDMATIDVIVRKIGDRYYSIMKDEKFPSFDHTDGKGIRMASAPTLLGPWTEPSRRITPNYREAPTLIPRPNGDGWYLYYEQYPGKQYGLSTAPEINGPWYDVYIENYSMPENARHGCIITLTPEQYESITNKYGKSN